MPGASEAQPVASDVGGCSRDRLVIRRGANVDAFPMACGPTPLGGSNEERRSALTMRHPRRQAPLGVMA